MSSDHSVKLLFPRSIMSSYSSLEVRNKEFTCREVLTTPWGVWMCLSQTMMMSPCLLKRILFPTERIFLKRQCLTATTLSKGKSSAWIKTTWAASCFILNERHRKQTQKWFVLEATNVYLPQHWHFHVGASPKLMNSIWGLEEEIGLWCSQIEKHKQGTVDQSMKTKDKPADRKPDPEGSRLKAERKTEEEEESQSWDENQMICCWNMIPICGIHLACTSLLQKIELMRTR